MVAYSAREIIKCKKIGLQARYRSFLSANLARVAGELSKTRNGAAKCHTGSNKVGKARLNANVKAKSIRLS